MMSGLSCTSARTEHGASMSTRRVAFWLTKYLSQAQRQAYSLSQRPDYDMKRTAASMRMGVKSVVILVKRAQEHLELLNVAKSKGSSATPLDFKVSLAQQLIDAGISTMVDVEKLVKQGTLDAFLEKAGLSSCKKSLLQALEIFTDMRKTRGE